MMFTESSTFWYLISVIAALVGTVGTWLQTNAIAEQADGIQNSLENILEQFYQSSFVKVSSVIPVVQKCLPESTFKFPDSGRSSSWIETLYENLPFIRTNFMARQALSQAKKNARTFAKQKETFESSVLGKMLDTLGASLGEVEVTESTHSKIYVCCLVISSVLLVTFALIDLFKCLKSRPGTKNPASQDQKEKALKSTKNDAAITIDRDLVEETPKAGELSLEETQQNLHGKGEESKQEEEETGNHYDDKEESEKINEMMDEKEPENYGEETVEIEDSAVSPPLAERVESLDYRDENLEKEDEKDNSSQHDADLPTFVETGECRFKIRMDEKDQAIIFDKKGNLIKPLQGKALVNVLPRAKGDPYLTVEGGREEVEIAVDAMFDYIRQWKVNHQPVQVAPKTTLNPAPSADENLKRKNENEFNFEVGKEHSGIVLGKGGVHAAKYFKENKVTIKLHTNELQGNTLVTLSGNPSDVKVVHEDIMKRLKAQKEYIARKELSKPLDEPTEVVPGLLRVAGNKFVFRIKDFQRKYLIGPSGKTVRILEEYFGVAIHARQDGTDAKSVVCEIVGLKDDVIWAFEEIEIVLRQRGLKFDEKGNLQNNSSENDLFRCSLQAVPAAKEIVQPKVATPRCSLQAVPAAKEIVQPKVATPAPLKVSIPSTSGSGQGRVLSFSQAVKGSRPRSPRFWEFLTPKPQRVRRLRRQRGTPSNVETSTTPKNTGAIPKVPKEPKGPAHLIKSSSPENNSS